MNVRRTSTMIGGSARMARNSITGGLRPINNSKLETAKKMTEKTLGGARRQSKNTNNHDVSFDRMLRE